MNFLLAVSITLCRKSMAAWAAFKPEVEWFNLRVQLISIWPYKSNYYSTFTLVGVSQQWRQCHFHVESEELSTSSLHGLWNLSLGIELLVNHLPKIQANPSMGSNSDACMWLSQKGPMLMVWSHWDWHIFFFLI